MAAKKTVKKAVKPAYTGEVFDPNAAGDETECFRFTVRATGDEVYEVPLMEYLSASLVARVRRNTMLLRPFVNEDTGELKKEPPHKVLQDLVDVQAEILKLAHPDIYERATEKEMGRIWNAWGQASGMTLGES